MNLKLKIKFNYYWFLRIIYPLLIAIILIGLVTMTLFLYQDFYQTITQAEMVTILRSQVASEAINIKIFEEVLKKIDAKTSQADIGTRLTKNPFVLVVTPVIPPPKIE